MTRHPEPGYRFDEATGQLFFSRQDKEEIVGDIDLALVWTSDEDGNGCLHKHGRKEFIEERAALIRTIDETTKIVTIPWEALRHPEAGPEIIEEVNNCLSISGRVSKIEAFLQDIAETHDIEVFPRATPEQTVEMTP
jgi:hypothetical protein